MIDETLAADVLAAVPAEPLRGGPLRRAAMARLAALPGYDWCGVYRLEGEELVLDEFEGEPTEHTRIPIGRGVCGTAVSERRNVVVDDVRELENYLSCSAATRSEIVVLIEADGRILGQIDVDGHAAAAFGATDEAMLARLAAILAERWN